MGMKKSIGPYILKELIGKGGMGEVYRAYDTRHGRDIALKVIKDSLLKNALSKKRFLQEAHINAQLSHPSIMPIYEIHQNEEGISYSMPYIQGCTLKTHLLHLRQTPSLMPLSARLQHFIKVLEAVSYTHDKGFLHRDIKADNILIGHHGETLLFDWGLACALHDAQTDEDTESAANAQLTRPGKIPGTLTHLAPERAQGTPATIASDLFSLGVVLYQLLTLKLPFQRKDIHHFKQMAGTETFLTPSSVNLTDDIDEALDWVTQKALAIDPKERYQSADQFKADLEKIVRGLPVWKKGLKLDLGNPTHWLFQDLLPLGDYVALNQKALTWGILSVPYVELLDNYKLVLESIVPNNGFKIYLDIASKQSTFDLESAFILEVHPEKGLSLYRFLALLEVKSISVIPDQVVKFTLEKIGNHFTVYIEDQPIYQFSSTLPRICPYIGILIQDEEALRSSIQLFSASSNKKVSCLKLGDTLLFHQQYSLARLEYEKLAQSFHEHEEGRLALFRKGYSYILEAKHSKKVQKKLLLQAIQVFEEFKSTRAAPWEYWGKALAYEALGEKQEAQKCFELCFRKFKNHPFTEQVKEELVVLFSQKSVKAKKEALHLALIALRYLDEYTFYHKYPELIASLEEDLSQLNILWNPEALSSKDCLIFSLAFALKQNLFFEEVLLKSDQLLVRDTALLALIHLKSKKLTHKFVKTLDISEGVKNLFFNPHSEASQKGYLRLAQAAKRLLALSNSQDFSPQNAQEAFFEGLTRLLTQQKRYTHPLLLDEDKKFLEALYHGLSVKKTGLKKILKSSFFQESDRFIRTNFLISLLDKKPIDYFGYDKEALDFTIKSLF